MFCSLSGLPKCQSQDLSYCKGLSLTESALKAAWVQKWLVNRKLRPEAMAGLVHQAKKTGHNPYHLSNIFFDTKAADKVLKWTKERNANQAYIDPENYPNPDAAKTYLMGLMYPEGSPAHPSYPAGHAVVAGACITVLKAILDDQARLIDFLTPVKVDPTNYTLLTPLKDEGETEMTVGSEIDKLATNVACGRNFGGIHYRSDCEQGLLLGEAVAIAYLQDWARTYAEKGFTGFELTKRYGIRIRITATEVKKIC